MGATAPFTNVAFADEVIYNTLASASIPLEKS
jgi:hypothetical protein